MSRGQVNAMQQSTKTIFLTNETIGAEHGGAKHWVPEPRPGKCNAIIHQKMGGSQAWREQRAGSEAPS